jgi:hypothetical protein
VFTSHLLVAFSFALALPPSLLQFAFELRALLVGAMEGEGSPILDVVGDVSKVLLLEVPRKVPLSEVSTTSSSSDDSSEVAASDDAETQAKDTLVVDPRKAMTLGPHPLLWAAFINWTLWAILPRVLCMN